MGLVQFLGTHIPSCSIADRQCVCHAHVLHLLSPLLESFSERKYLLILGLVLPFQLPLRFNDSLVLRQLRYTGMLETVCIRQSGYSCKYSFQVEYHRLCLPSPLASLTESSECCWFIFYQGD